MHFFSVFSAVLLSRSGVFRTIWLILLTLFGDWGGSTMNCFDHLRWSFEAINRSDHSRRSFKSIKALCLTFRTWNEEALEALARTTINYSYSTRSLHSHSCSRNLSRLIHPQKCNYRCNFMSISRANWFIADDHSICQSFNHELSMSLTEINGKLLISRSFPFKWRNESFSHHECCPSHCIVSQSFAFCNYDERKLRRKLVFWFEFLLKVKTENPFCCSSAHEHKPHLRKQDVSFSFVRIIKNIFFFFNLKVIQRYWIIN